MNGYSFINRSIWVPLDLRDSKIAFFMKETTNSVFITIFSLSLSLSPNSITLLSPIYDPQLFNEQTVSIFWHRSNKSNEIPTAFPPFSNPREDFRESGVKAVFIPVTAGGIPPLLYGLLSSATCSNIAGEGKLTGYDASSWFFPRTKLIHYSRRGEKRRQDCRAHPIETRVNKSGGNERNVLK